MAISLSPQQRAHLDGIVQKMQANGETDAYIQGVVDDFKAKYATGTIQPQPSHTSPTLGGAAPSIRRDIMNAIPTALPGVSAGQLANIAPAALGLTGGAVAGPLGAAGGGMAGEAFRQALMEDRINPVGIGGAGLTQGLAQGAGSALGAAAGNVGPMAARAAALMKNPIARRVMGAARIGVPTVGYASGGIPGAAVGAALPYAGRAAMKVAMNPRTAAILGSASFQAFARQSPRAAAELVQRLLYTDQPDATGGRLSGER